MIRAIDGFSHDDRGDWVAHLSCLHLRPIRHRPPFQERPWILTRSGRATGIGSDIECVLCDRAKPPEGIRLARTAGPFDADNLPGGLRKEHRVAERTWGVLRILAGFTNPLHGHQSSRH